MSSTGIPSGIVPVSLIHRHSNKLNPARIAPNSAASLAEATDVASPSSTSEVPTPRAPSCRRCFSGFCIGCGIAFLSLIWAIQSPARGEQVRVYHPEGTLHGFLSLTTEQGQVLAVGDLIEVVRGDHVSSHLVFHFKDGSLDDETTIYTQRGVFRLISSHHIQRGPYFPHPLDMTIDVAKGIVTTRTPGKDGKDEVATEHMKLPPDLCNGLVPPVVKNQSPDAAETKVSMIVATPKPRIVTLDILSRVEKSFTLAGIARKARAFEIKIELGGIAGVIAPVIGKQPPNIYFWIESGEVPVFLRETGPLFEGGAILSINLIGPTWPEGDH